MDLRYLRFFIAVAEERSFTRAAALLHTVQPSLSQQIKRLENEFVGTPLFQRDRHHVELTEAGKVFLPEARAILKSAERAIRLARQAASATTGHLVIGFVPGAEGKVFEHVLPQLRAGNPGMQLTLRSLSTPEQFTALCEQTIDVGFLRPPVESPLLESELVLREPIVAALPAHHPLATLDRIPVAQLAQLPMIQVARRSAPAVHDVAYQVAADSGVSFVALLETDSVLSTLNTIGAGLGFSLLPDYVTAICPPGVVTRPLDLASPPSLELVVAYRKNDTRPSLVTFLTLLRNWIATTAPHEESSDPAA
jgi:LysR family transcriptional regulator, hca operon transcriptional activator